MLRGSAGLLAVFLVAGCSWGDGRASFGRSGSRAPATIAVGGETVEVARLTEAVSGLCQARQQAATDPRAAKATYDRRSRYGVDTMARLLPPSDAATAAALTKAAEQVQADLAPAPASATLTDGLGRLTEELRRGLARLGIATGAC